MLANANLLGYKGLVNIKEEDNNGFDIEFLEGNLKGKKSYVSKNSKSETIEKIKASARLERKGRIKEDGHYSNDFVYFEITVTSNSLQNSEKIHEIITDRIIKEINELQFVGCPAEDENSYFDSLAIEIDYVEDIEIKEVFKTIKKNLGIR